MKRTLQQLSRIVNTAMSAVPSLGRVRVGLLLAIMMPIGAWAQNSTPTYIASIGIAQDGSSGSTGVNDCKNELSGHTIIDRDLNDGAGGDYVYIGYKTTTDPSKAITGIVFRVGGDPPSSITYNGYTFYLVGGSYETNTASEGGYIDLNGAAGGDYIYMYVTRDSGYGAPLTTMTVDESSSKSGYSTGTNTSGNVIDLNQNAGGDYLYLHYKRFSATVNATYYYLDSSGSRTSNSYSLNVKNHLEALTTKPSYPTSVTYGGRTFTFRGWREDNTAGAATVTAPSATYITGDKTYRAVYAADVKLSYDANGGDGAPAAQTATQYINAGSSSVAKQSVSFTIPNSTCTHSTKCFIGWSADKAAATAAYQPGGNISISSNTTLYAVYADHSYSSGICDHCGIPVSGSVAVLSKNDKNVFAGTTLDAVITEAENCVESDKAVVTLLQNIDLGNSSLTINSGVFSLDLNDFELQSTYSSGVLSLSGESVNVTLQDSGETGKITATGRAIMAEQNATLTIVGGTISSGGYGVYALSGATVNISGGTISSSNYGVYAYRKCEVNISGGTINGSNAVYVDNPGSGNRTDGAVVNISGGALNGTKYGVYVSEATGSSYKKIQVSINGGTINGDTYDIYTYYQYENHGWVKLNVNASGTGAIFPDGLTAKSVCYNDGAGTTLIPMNALLGESAAYWAGDTMLSVADDATEITGKGDITVKAACTHENGTKQSYANRGDNHTYRWSCCKLEVTEEHTFTDTECVCGAMDHTCQYTNGFCIEGCYEPAQLKDGYYQITNGGNLFWFAEYINTVDRTASAVLTADIDLENRPWTPIGETGEENNNFRGVFDGQNYTIRGLNVEGSENGVGFFGEVRTGTVKNFTIYGEVVVNTEVDYVGGVIGSACGLNSDNDLERNGATIRNITSYVNLTAGAHGISMVGGFIGYANHETLIENCAWYGTFDAGKYRVDSGAGGLLGRVYDNSAVTIRNCAAYGTIRSAYRSGTYNNQATIYIGGIVSYSSAGAQTVIENTLWAGTMANETDLGANAHISAIGTLSSFRSVTHCYALEGSAPYVTTNGTHDTHITTVTAGQLASGEVAYKLGDAWGQAIGSDPYPVLGGAAVYVGYAGNGDGTLTLYDGDALGYTNHTAFDRVTLHRTLGKGKYGTICLPFAPDAATLQHYAFYALSGAEDDVLRFEEVAAPEAGVPYLYGLRDEGTEGTPLTASDVTIVTAPAAVEHESGFTMHGSLSSSVIDCAALWEVTYHYAYSADRQELNRITKTLNVTPFRAYLTLPATADVSKVRVRIVTRGESTSIDNGQLTMDNEASGAVYDLQGRRVENPAKGVYIVNGRKVVIK